MPARIQTEEEKHVREAIRDLNAPRGVALREVHHDEDHAGSPALRVRFGVTTLPKLGKRRVRELVRYSAAVQQRLLQADMDRWPYVSFEEQPRRKRHAVRK